MARVVALAGLLVFAAIAVSPQPAQGEICTSSSGCEFWDNEYHMFMLGDWDTTKLDVLVVPPASPFATRDIVTIRKSIDAWESAVQTEGATWLTPHFDLRTYTLGVDTPTVAALSDPEIVVMSAEYNPVLLFGIGLEQPVSVCTRYGSSAAPLVHQHEGSSWRVVRAECVEGGTRCYVINTSFLLGGARQMYDLNSHEFGHCLGIGHVGDAMDFDAKTVPLDDIMSYQHDPSHVHCVSNLNIAGINGAFARIRGRPTGEWLDYGDYVDMAVADYDQVTCSNP